jgi:hypothetical protein
MLMAITRAKNRARFAVVWLRHVTTPGCAAMVPMTVVAKTTLFNLV